MKNLFGLTLLCALLYSSSAFAFDGYKDRRGVFTGLGLGAGFGSSEVDEPSDLTGFEDGREAGLMIHALIGGGVTQDLMFWAEGSAWIRTVKINDRSLSHYHLNLIPTIGFFVIDGLYPFVGGGLAYASFETERADETYSYREFGLAAKAGLGYEVFLNGTVAIGAQANYTRHFYGEGSFDTFGGGLTVRWY